MTAVVPAAMAMARPVPSTVATAVFEEVQETSGVISWLVPSEFVPRAANCWVVLLGTDENTVMPVNVGPDDELPQVVRETAKDPINKIVQTNLIFFILRAPPKPYRPPHLGQMVIAIY